jgi:hypothetical protein
MLSAMSQPSELEADLRQHGAGLHRLAAALVGAGNAGDAVQEVWLASLESPARQPGPSRWLAAHRAATHRRPGATCGAAARSPGAGRGRAPRQHGGGPRGDLGARGTGASPGRCRARPRPAVSRADLATLLSKASRRARSRACAANRSPRPSASCIVGSRCCDSASANGNTSIGGSGWRARSAFVSRNWRRLAASREQESCHDAAPVAPCNLRFCGLSCRCVKGRPQQECRGRRNCPPLASPPCRPRKGSDAST